MRILMISKACLVGTYQRKLEELARCPGVELTVVVPPSWRDARGELRLERAHVTGYELVVERIVFNGQHHLHFYPGLARRVTRLRPEVIHADEEPYSLVTFQALQLAGRAGARGVFFSWQNICKNYPPPFSWIERTNLGRADYCIAGNQAAAAVWRAKGFRGPIAVVPQFGVDPELFSPPPPRGPGSRPPGRGLVIGYAGRLTEEKGVDLLLRAAARLPGEWRLAIAGSGPQRAALEQLAAELGIAGQVSFDAWLPSAQMPAFFRQLDVLVLPSRTRPGWKEQFGRVLVEAMACEAVAVGADSGEIPRVIGDAGLVFPEDDADALAADLVRLMRDDALRAELGRRGRARVLAHFTQEQIARRTYAVYQALVPDGSPAQVTNS
jgi:glycosyltransferase involved in cell wall biosynthesis